MESRKDRHSSWIRRRFKRDVHKRVNVGLDMDVLSRPEKKPSIWFMNSLKVVFVAFLLGLTFYFATGDVSKNAYLSRWVGVSLFTDDKTKAADQERSRELEADREAKASREKSELKRVILTDPKTGLPLRNAGVHN